MRGRPVNKFTPKKKQPKAIWTSVQSPGFKRQQQSLRPENGAAGGVKARSKPMEVRMAMYNPIRDLFLSSRSKCEIECNEACQDLSVDVHHSKGKDGLLLFDIRYWIPACRNCHNHVTANPKEAAEHGWTLGSQWNRQDA